ncbi:MAG: hypothetical protein ABW170_17845 [Candidatus Thiodiazotropha sp. L084R]
MVEEKKVFTKPDWESISRELDAGSAKKEISAFWERKSNIWLSSLSSEMSGDISQFESDNFKILTCESERYATLFTSFLERTLSRISKSLPGIARDEAHGKHIVLIFSDVGEYYDYLDQYFAEVDYAPNSGVYLNEGYGHFAFPTQDLNIAETIAVHELTHACLAHLDLPHWINEGLAVNMEVTLGVSGANLINADFDKRHAKFWNSVSINRFWSGSSFYEYGPGQELSYSLAFILISNLVHDYEVFKEFVLSSVSKDAGEAAFVKHYGTSLGVMVTEILGEGTWSPKETEDDYS